jgi:hypothetical protein
MTITITQVKKREGKGKERRAAYGENCPTATAWPCMASQQTAESF